MAHSLLQLLKIIRQVLFTFRNVCGTKLFSYAERCNTVGILDRDVQSLNAYPPFDLEELRGMDFDTPHSC
eukprot:9432592-Pyramimonas_sp.AAC.1